MALFVSDCPRCGAKKITFDINGCNTASDDDIFDEIFCVCRACNYATIFEVVFCGDGFYHNITELIRSVNRDISSDCDLLGHATILGTPLIPPEHLPPNIEKSFRESATCLAVGCYNASGAMCRLCLDLATKTMLPEKDIDDINNKTRRDLGLRLPWLFDHGKLPEGLRELSACIKNDGNDGAHDGNLSKEEAEDLLDFTFVLLERIYTEPKRLELAKERREARRAKK